MLKCKKLLSRKRKAALRAAQEISRDMNIDQLNEEFLDKPKKETSSEIQSDRIERQMWREGMKV